MVFFVLCDFVVFFFGGSFSVFVLGCCLWFFVLVVCCGVLGFGCGFSVLFGCGFVVVVLGSLLGCFFFCFLFVFCGLCCFSFWGFFFVFCYFCCGALVWVLFALPGGVVYLSRCWVGGFFWVFLGCSFLIVWVRGCVGWVCFFFLSVFLCLLACMFGLLLGCVCFLVFFSWGLFFELGVGFFLCCAGGVSCMCVVFCFFCAVPGVVVVACDCFVASSFRGPFYSDVVVFRWIAGWALCWVFCVLLLLFRVCVVAFFGVFLWFSSWLGLLDFVRFQVHLRCFFAWLRLLRLLVWVCFGLLVILCGGFGLAFVF